MSNLALQSAKKHGGHAIVLGGGIGGLTAAVVLSRHFDDVTVVERDHYPTAADATVRPHAAHGAHAHLLLAGGLVTLQRLIPELAGWFDDIGAPPGDLTHHTRVAFEGRWLPRSMSGIPIRTCTRADVEWLLRRAALARGNVRILEDHMATGLVGTERVTGVRLEHAGQPLELAAALVVDATGRSSTSSQWLAAAGVTVEETIVDAQIGYVSAWFESGVDIDDDWTVLATLPSIPHDARMGVIIRFGARRLLVSAIDYGKIAAPTTHDELVARFAALKVPQLHRLLMTAKPVSPLSSYGNTKNRWRRYGKLARFPDGLVAIGDAVCSLNPRYGQGMTVASLSVDRLDKELAANDSLDGFSRKFQRGLERVLVVPWQIALLEDRAWVSSLSGSQPSLPQRLAVAGSQRVLKTAFSDVGFYIRFMRVAQMLDGPTSMLSASTLGKIMRGPTGAGVEDAPRIGAAA